VCTVYEVDSDGELVYIAMEKIEGETLRERVLSQRELLSALSEAARGMQAAHDAGLFIATSNPTMSWWRAITGNCGSWFATLGRRRLALPPVLT
tara:strand:- start:13339 stop:13620 length:282 start_codon:yes stop_codon:yes gene_type:complete